jgi:hypothetical protein
MLTLDSVLRRAADVRYRRVGDESVVLRQRAAEVLGLNEVGGRLFDLLDGETPVAGLLARLAEEFEVERAPLASDVLAFLSRLVEVGVVEEVGAAAPVAGAAR